MVKAASKILTQADFEQLYAEVETRLERKWKDRFERLERELERTKKERDYWREKFYKEEETSRRLYNQVQKLQAENRDLKVLVEKLQARVAELEKQLYGKKTETSKKVPKSGQEEPKRSRGRQVGAPGYGRKKRDLLPTEDLIHEIPASDLLCGSCGEAYTPMGEVVSEEIDIEYKLVKLVHHRKKARRTCQCTKSPKFKIAPAPPKLVKGGLLSIDFWAYALFEKYQLQRPINKQIQLWAAHGLSIGQGAITQGLKRIHTRAIFQPLIEEIQERIRSGKKQKSDETGWKVFQHIEGKEGYQHWLWATLGEDACLFRIDPTRSKAVAQAMIGEQPTVLVSDRLSSYRNLGDNVINSWCWAHIRREFIKIQTIKKLQPIGEAWVRRVDELYHLNHLRLADGANDFEHYDQKLKNAVAEFERQLKANAKRKNMHPAATKLFKNIADDWPGLTVFVRLPEISMDNNESERALRTPVVGRKNYYGSGSLWSANLTADLFTIFATLKMNDVNIIDWLRVYLRAVADAGGVAPPNATKFLPWNSK